MNEEQIKQMAEKELVAYLKGYGFSLCPTSKKYMAEHIEEILKQAEATKELQEEIAGLKTLMKSEHKIEARKNNNLISQLTKAKEIIREILAEDDYSQCMYKELRAKAEAFLKE